MADNNVGVIMSGAYASPGVGGYGAGLGATQAVSPTTERTQFQQFCKEEMIYHMGMHAMYERVLAQDLLTTDGDQAGELMRTIFIAGLHALAREHKG